MYFPTCHCTWSLSNHQSSLKWDVGKQRRAAGQKKLVILFDKDLNDMVLPYCSSKKWKSRSLTVERSSRIPRCFQNCPVCFILQIIELNGSKLFRIGISGKFRACMASFLCWRLFSTKNVPYRERYILRISHDGHVWQHSTKNIFK